MCKSKYIPFGIIDLYNTVINSSFRFNTFFAFFFQRTTPNIDNTITTNKPIIEPAMAAVLDEVVGDVVFWIVWAVNLVTLKKKQLYFVTRCKRIEDL